MTEFDSDLSAKVDIALAGVKKIRTEARAASIVLAQVRDYLDNKATAEEAQANDSTEHTAGD